jgi:uncharacterized membrane protein YbhN (UPF0104 family)
VVGAPAQHRLLVLAVQQPRVVVAAGYDVAQALEHLPQRGLLGHLLDRLGGHVSTFAETFADIDPRLLILAGLLHVSNHVLRSFAWRSVLAAAYPDRRVPMTGVTAAYASGVALNAMLPARGGDAAKLAIARAEIRGSTLTTIGATISVLLPFDILAAAVTVLLLTATGDTPVAVNWDSMAAAGGWLTSHLALAVPIAVLGLAVSLLAVRYLRPRIHQVWERIRQGGAILRTPRRYALRVVFPQALGWMCRIGVVMCLLAAFGLPASLAMAVLVMVVAGASTFVPLTPGGAGTQQVFLAYALSEAASSAAVVSFSVGMQAGVTAVNALLGLGAAMLACRSVRVVSMMRHRMRTVEA